MMRWLRGIALFLLAFSLWPSSLARAADAAPFRVISLGANTLVLARERPNQNGTEGVVIDSEALLASAKARVLQAQGLDEVAELESSSNYSEFGSLGSRGALRKSAKSYAFTHDFGAPLESLHASLDLQPLAEPEAGNLIVPLSLVLALSLIAGLFALYRMAATQVRFAERRNNFVAAVSHELKTPLTAIRMHAEMLDEDLVDGDAKRHDYYRTITRESERLTRLIDNVLALAQIERGTRRLSLMVGDIRPSVREGVEMLRPQVQAQGFELEFESDSNLPNVRFEPDALKQVLFNLVENALKYGREASDRRITVSCKRDGDGVAVSVRDRGPGVQREHLKSVFEPFFRGEHELTRKNQGTGIGLSLVKGLASAMGASVQGENAEPGFSVRLLLPAR
ncbi:MAG: HAMP domain-containing sensor histidine kinase [Polyangiaceae bacterium]